MAVDRLRLPFLCACLVVTLALTGCTSGTTASSPTPPADTSTNFGGTWTGSASDSSGSGTMSWTLTQSGGTVTGNVTATATANGQTVTGRGTLNGSVAGSTLTFALTIPNGGFDGAFSGCNSSMSGTATLSGSTLSGTYSGSSTCNSNPTIASGQFTLNKQ